MGIAQENLKKSLLHHGFLIFSVLVLDQTIFRGMLYCLLNHSTLTYES